MKVLAAYILKENLAAFLLGLVLLTFILMMDRFYDLVDLIIGKGLHPLIVGEVFVLSLPFILALTVPMAVLVGTIVAFGRMSHDHELLALQAGGIGFFSVVLPVLISASLLACGLIFFNNHILPGSNHRVKNLMIDISQKRPTVQIREGIFIPDFPGYQIYAERTDHRNSRLQGVTIYETKSGSQSRIISAREGRYEFSAGKNVFTMELDHGEIHEIDEKDPERSLFLKFRKHTINIPMDVEMVRREREFRSDRELSAGEMMDKVRTLRDEMEQKLSEARQSEERASAGLTLEIASKRRQINKYLVEIHKKYAIPIACIVFVLIGAPIGYHLRRGGLGIGMGVSIGFFLLYYLGLRVGEGIADRGIVSAWLSMWSPNIIIGGIGIFLSYATNAGLPIRFWRSE